MNERSVIRPKIFFPTEYHWKGMSESHISLPVCGCINRQGAIMNWNISQDNSA